jgi:hypothetical protein
MPSALNRSREAGGYGWNHVFGRDNRALSQQFKDRFDQIEWDSKLGEPDGENRLFRLGGVAKVWREGRFRKGKYGT